MGNGRSTAGRVAGATIAVALLAGTAACASSAPPASSGTTGGGASCAALLVYGGREYLGNAPARPVRAGRSLGTATQPACYDNFANGTALGEPAQEIEVNAVAGIDPQWAIYDGRQGIVYVARERPSGAMPAALREALRR